MNAKWTLIDTDRVGLSSDVDFIDIVDLQQKLDYKHPQSGVLLADVEVRVHMFKLHTQPGTSLEDEPGGNAQESDSVEDVQEKEQFRAYVTLLPHADFQDLWKS